MRDSIARARTRPEGQAQARRQGILYARPSARATIGYLVYKSKSILHTSDLVLYTDTIYLTSRALGLAAAFSVFRPMECAREHRYLAYKAELKK